MDKDRSPIQTRKLSRPGAAAARSHQAVMDLRAAEERRRQAYREQLEEAERAAATGESRLRRIEREERRQQEGRFAALLGRMVLAALKRQGMSGSLLTVDDLASWTAQDREDLSSFLNLDVNRAIDRTDVQSVVSEHWSASPSPDA